jgi:hypothetical protein
MKTHLLKALLATILLVLGLTKASAAIDPSARAGTTLQEMASAPACDLPCVGSACDYLE